MGALTWVVRLGVNAMCAGAHNRKKGEALKEENLDH